MIELTGMNCTFIFKSVPTDTSGSRYIRLKMNSLDTKFYFMSDPTFVKLFSLKELLSPPFKVDSNITLLRFLLFYA